MTNQPFSGQIFHKYFFSPGSSQIFAAVLFNWTLTFFTHFSKWNWENAVTQIFLSEIISTTENGGGGTYFARFLLSQILQGSTQSLGNHWKQCYMRPFQTSCSAHCPKDSLEEWYDIKNCLFGTLSILNNIKQRAIRTNHKTKFRRCLNIPSPLRSALKPGHRPINNIWDKPSTLQQKEDSIFINILNRISINILNYIFFFWVPVEFCFPFDCYNSDFDAV